MAERSASATAETPDHGNTSARSNTLSAAGKLGGRGNGPVLIARMQNAQQMYGNRAMQRMMRRGNLSATSSMPVQQRADGPVRGSDQVQRAIPKGAITSDKLRAFGTIDQTEFMRRVYDAQLADTAKTKQFYMGVPKDQLEEVEGGKMLHQDAAKDGKALLAQARADLAKQQAEKDVHALKVKSIGIASAYRSLTSDFSAWRDAFSTRYNKTKDERANLPGGEHGQEAFKLVLSGMKKYKAVPGFSNHTKGMAIDFKTKEGKKTLSAKSSHKAGWQKSWLYNWLTSNAANHGFQPLTTEEWHWDHKAGANADDGDINTDAAASAYDWGSIGAGLAALIPGAGPGVVGAAGLGAGLAGAASALFGGLFGKSESESGGQD